MLIFKQIQIYDAATILYKSLEDSTIKSDTVRTHKKFHGHKRCRQDFGSYTACLAVAILASQIWSPFTFHLWTHFIYGHISSIILILSSRNPHGWNLPDHAILTVLNTSGFMAWKPSYGDAEVAGFLFTYYLE